MRRVSSVMRSSGVLGFVVGLAMRMNLWPRRAIVPLAERNGGTKRQRGCPSRSGRKHPLIADLRFQRKAVAVTFESSGDGTGNLRLTPCPTVDGCGLDAQERGGPQLRHAELLQDVPEHLCRHAKLRGGWPRGVEPPSLMCDDQN